MNVGHWEAGKRVVGAMEVAGTLLTVELLFEIGTWILVCFVVGFFP